MIQTLLLDVDNTLLDFHAGAELCIREGFAAWGLPYREDTFAIFTPLNNRLWREIELGLRTREDLYRERWNIVFAALGIEADGPAFEAEFRRRLTQSALPVEGAMEILPYLAERYTLCVASNGPYAQQVDRLRRAGMLPFMQHLFVSEAIGFQKPTPGFFDACMAALGNPDPATVMIIGDSLTADVGGGRDYGLQTCWYNHDRLPLPLAGTADRIIHRLDELRTFL